MFLKFPFKKGGTVGQHSLCLGVKGLQLSTSTKGKVDRWDSKSLCVGVKGFGAGLSFMAHTGQLGQ